MINFDNKAIEIVKDYIAENLDKSESMPDFTVYTLNGQKGGRLWSTY